MTESEKLRAMVEKGIARCVTDGKWSWHGTRFTSQTYWGLKGTAVWVKFTATFHYVKVIVEGEHHGLPNAEKTFEGADNLIEAVQWAADKYLEMHYTVQARLAPYRYGQEEYDRAWRGIIS